jgi:Protein of unknown function (DUF1073)
MSGTQGANLVEGGIGFSELGLQGGPGSQLTQLLTAEAIVPGSSAGYQLCKTVYVFHPLGAKMTEVPVNMAQSQQRELTVPDGPEERLVAAFKREWKAIGADNWIKNAMVTARIYGISSIVMGDRRNSAQSAQPVNVEKLHEIDPYFSVLDPLNTAGSLVLNQDPNSPDFQKAREVRVGSVTYHPSRTVVTMNENPIYIEWSSSAFGFTGRSVFQRALYPLKTFTQSMITDQWVTLKVGLLIAKMQPPGPVINSRIMNFFGIKRSQLKAGITGNVLTIGEKDDISSLNFQNLEGPAKFARDNALKNVAMAAGMPAKLLEQEEMIGGMAEGTEDAKQIARFIDTVRTDMDPLYRFFDRIVQRRAWSPRFYEALQADIKEYKKVPYETAFYQWSNSFTATWPNLLAEPESKEIEVEKARFESVVALLESLVNAGLDPENKAHVIAWVADEVNSRRRLFSAPLDIDEALLAAYIPPQPAADDREAEPAAFSEHT